MILTKGYLDSQSKTRQIYNTDSAHRQAIFENKEILQKSAKSTYDIFLSHRYLDRKLVYTLMRLMNEAGYSVYVDWIEDPDLDRNNVDSYTASVLKLRMMTSKGLAYVATDNSSYSKWCPWELGYMDGKRGRTCILPVLDYSSYSFEGTEYLGLYPYIEYAQELETGKYNFWVYSQTDSSKYIRLDFWLNGSNPCKH